jgi:hypothetical protein
MREASALLSINRTYPMLTFPGSPSAELDDCEKIGWNDTQAMTSGPPGR